jgi:hypothetical protein
VSSPASGVRPGSAKRTEKHGPISRAVASATSRFARSRARKTVRGWPCEVDAPPPWGRDGVASLKAVTRVAWEEDARARAVQKMSRRDCLAAAGLASGPADSANARRPSGLISCVERPVERAPFAKLPVRIYAHPVCNLGTDGETSIRTAAVPSGATPRGGRTWLQRLDFCGSKRKKPHSTICSWSGAIAPTSHSPTPAKTTGEGRWCLTPEFTSALGAPG